MVLPLLLKILGEVGKLVELTNLPSCQKEVDNILVTKTEEWYLRFPENVDLLNEWA